MECRDVRRSIHDAIDGRLPPGRAAEVAGHLRGCEGCAREEEALRRVGDLVRLWAAARASAGEARLETTWTRVKGGIAEGRPPRRMPWVAALRWLWLPAAAALAVLAVLFYPSGGKRGPFAPANFEVAVESLEAEDATVALVDRGEDLPRVIWIIENGHT